MSNHPFPKLSSRKMIVHVGASKTGTTAIQQFCAHNQSRLLEHGVWYPLCVEDGEWKHQWLVRDFSAGDRAALMKHLALMEANCPDTAQTIFLSTEGLSYHFQRFPDEGHACFKLLIQLFNPHCLFVTRERGPFLDSVYKQCIINPRIESLPEFATAETYEQWAAQSFVQNLGSPTYLMEKFVEYFGANNYTQLTYSKDIGRDVLATVLGAETPSDWSIVGQSNVSLSTAEAELIRWLNGIGIANEDKLMLTKRFKRARLGRDLPPVSEVQASRLAQALRAVSSAQAQSSDRFSVASNEVHDIRRQLLAEFASEEASAPVKDPGTERPRVLFACVADNSHKYKGQAVRLVESLRWFGGSLANADFVVGLVDEADPVYVDKLRSLGATIQVLPRFSPLHGPSNKLSMVEWLRSSDLSAAYDSMVLLDCDTVILQDPAPWVAGGTFRAKMADSATVPHATFERIFSHFGLEVPPQAYRTNPGDQETIWYCNAGVLVFPPAILSEFGPNWVKWNSRLLEHLDLLGERMFFCEQASLSLAFAESAVPFSELPIEMNYPLYPDPHSVPSLREPVAPVILHYHNNITPNGMLKAGPNPLCQAGINRYNDQVATQRRRRFDMQLFWDFRYTHAPELGSGVGSRGRTAEYKRDLLRHLITDRQPATVLDVGCGDQYVSSALPTEGYLGIDISSAVVERNRDLYPGRRFECLDFAAQEVTVPTAEAVVCLDVLIHLDSPDTYQTFVQRLVASTERFGLIAGYEAEPDGQSDMVFFHEPLSETLRRYGVHSLQRVGGYSRNTVLWRYGVGSTPLEPADLTGRTLLCEEDAPADTRDQQLVEQQRIITQQAQTITDLKNSTSWRITAPLRSLVTLSRKLRVKSRG
jgi:hypothetical protein